MSWVDSLNPTAVLTCDPATGQPLQAFVRATDVVRAAKAMLRQGYFLEDVTGLDTAEGIEVVYHFDHMDTPGRATLRVLVPHGAEWHERETMDFFPVVFAGNPNQSRLLLPAEMEPGVLAKDAKARASLAVLMQWSELDIRDESAPECAALAAKVAAAEAAAAAAKAKSKAKEEVQA